MKSSRHFVTIGAVFVFAFSIGSVEAWGQECSPFELQIKGETSFYLADSFTPELLEAIGQCFSTNQIAEFEYCFSTPLFGGFTGDAIGCGNSAWEMPDPYGVGFEGSLWRNPVAYILPEGAICGMEHSISHWGETIQIFAALQQITHGNGAYANVTGWLTSDPSGRVSARHGIGRMDGWLCSP